MNMNVQQWIALNGFIDAYQVFSTAALITFLSVTSGMISYYSGLLSVRGACIIGVLTSGAIYVILPDLIDLGPIDDFFIIFSALVQTFILLSLRTFPKLNSPNDRYK